MQVPYEVLQRQEDHLARRTTARSA
jgi:hypothetical protein